MEHVHISLGDNELFDRSVKEGLPEGGDLLLVTKDKGTEEGRPTVCLSFTVQLPNGELAKAQIVVTGRLFAGMAAAFRGRYGIDGDRVIANTNYQH